MTAFFEYLEMSRPTAVVARNTAGSNSGAPAVLPFVLGLTGFGRGVRDITASIQAGAQLSLSHRAWGAAAGDTAICMLPDTEVQDPKMLCQKRKVSRLEQLPSFRETSLIHHRNGFGPR